MYVKALPLITETCKLQWRKKAPVVEGEHDAGRNTDSPNAKIISFDDQYKHKIFAFWRPIITHKHKKLQQFLCIQR